MKLVPSILCSLLASAAAISTAAADTTVTVSATKDAMIFGTSANADTNNASGKGPALFSGADGQSNKKRSTIVFDIASAGIPANATIVSVTMTMYLAQVAGSGGGSTGSYPNRTLKLHRVQQTWGEGTSGSPTSPTVSGTGQGYTRVSGDSSWSYAIYSGTAWTAGGNFNATASATSTFSTPFVLNAAYTWSSAGMVTDVGAWVSGSSTNYGWLVKSDLETSPTSFLGYWSRDGAAANSNPAIAPKLTIVYR
jgi:hypothetical protein